MFYYSLTEVRNRIYFNIWLNQIIQKNELGKFLKWKDPHLGYQIEDSEKYAIDKQNYVTTNDITISFEYIKKDKKLNIYLNIFNTRNAKEVRYNDMPEEIAQKICNHIALLISENGLIIDGNKDYDVTKNYIDSIQFYFLFNPDDMASGNRIGGLIYKRNNKNNSFDFLKSFDNGSLN